MSTLIAKIVSKLASSCPHRLWLVCNPDGFLTKPNVRTNLRNEHNIEVVTGSSLELRIHFELHYRQNSTPRYIYICDDSDSMLPDIKAEADVVAFDITDLFPLFADKPLLRRQTPEVLDRLYDMPMLRKILPAQCKSMVDEITEAIERERATSADTLLDALQKVEIDWTTAKQADTMRNLSQLFIKAIKLGHADKLSEDIKKINEKFQQWMDTGYFSALNSNPLLRPQSVNKVLPHIEANYPRESEEKMALVVVDGMTYWQWLVLEEKLMQEGLMPNTSTIVSWLPSITMLSRQALFRGEQPKMDYVQNPTNERKLWMDFWQQHGVWSNETHYIYDGEPFEWHHDTRRLAVCTVTLDEMMHASHHYSDLLDLTENWAQRFAPRILKLKENGFTIYLTTDHGNILADGWRTLTQEEKVYLYSSGSRGHRHLIYKPSASEAREEMVNYGTREISTMARDNFVCVRGTEAFIRAGQREITHGGCHFLEVVIPFIKI